MNNPFDRTIINPRERPLGSDINQAQSQLDRTIRRVLDLTTRPRWATLVEPAVAPADYESKSRSETDTAGVSGVSASFVSDGFKARAFKTPTMNVWLRGGIGFKTSTPQTFISGISGIDDLESSQPLVINDDQTIAVPAADPTNPRFDIIEVAVDRRIEAPSSRDVFNVLAGKFLPDLVNKSLSYVLDGQVSINGSMPINYKTGTPNPSPATPTNTTGYVTIARVRVDAAVVSIGQESIVDQRFIRAPGGVVSGGGSYISGSTAHFGSVDFNAPPGIEFALVQGAPYGQTVYVWGPQQFRGFTFCVSVEPGADFHYATGGPNFIGPADGTIQTLINTVSALTTRTAKIALDQWVAQIPVIVKKIDTGALVNGVDGQRVSFSFSFSRNLR